MCKCCKWYRFLEIAIKALNLKKGSEIIVPANTWISTAEAVISNGHKLFFVT